MDAADLFSAWRDYYRKRRLELLEGLLGCTDIEKQRGRVRELDDNNKRMDELMKATGDSNDD